MPENDDVKIETTIEKPSPQLVQKVVIFAAATAGLYLAGGFLRRHASKTTEFDFENDLDPVITTES